MSLESLYQELILDHSKKPHGKGLAEVAPGHPTADSHQRNPVCGDEVTLRAELAEDGTTIERVTWDGQGCSISQASASMLTDLIAGTSVADAQVLVDGFRDALRSRGQIALDEEVYEDAAALTGVSKFSARVKCAMLAWVALEDAVARATPAE